LIVVHESVVPSGFGAEVAATIAERCFGALRAPVRRLGSPRVPIAYAPPLEDLVRVSPAQIAGSARALVRG